MASEWAKYINSFLAERDGKVISAVPSANIFPGEVVLTMIYIVGEKLNTVIMRKAGDSAVELYENEETYSLIRQGMSNLLSGKNNPKA